MKHSLWRDRKTQKQYVDHVQKQPKDSGCPFCVFTPQHDEVVRDEELFWVARNSFPYATWDGLYVDEHLMLIPKRHTVSVGTFTDSERSAFAKLVGEYENNGYSIYGRAAENAAKSVAHQHTHLLKITPRRVNTLFFSDRLKLTLFR